jgi:hypothetical protein
LQNLATIFNAAIHGRQTIIVGFRHTPLSWGQKFLALCPQAPKKALIKFG